MIKRIIFATGNPGKVREIDEILAAAGTPEDFKNGRAPSCITDIRGAGDMERAQFMGKAPYFETESIEAGGELVQRIGITSSAGEEKLPYMLGFIEYLTAEEAQSALSKIGLLPVIGDIEPEFERDYLKDLYTMLLQNGPNYGNIKVE